MAKKKRTSFALDPEILELLDLMAKNDARSQANMLEVLIREKAAALGLTAKS